MSKMKTITFFSYKGGVGRTLSATNFAVYLAKLGLKVAIMDFDLEAPGVDSKFPNYELANGQAGLIDYLLEFQRGGEPPGPVKPIVCEISIPTPSLMEDNVLFLIPAGDYLAADYSAKLNELDWDQVFSEERNGVAFFQLFLEKLESDLGLEVLIIDSRTGFSEIGGLCTQQLADETVILSSMAAESIKMTRHLSRIIRESEIAYQLNKKVETKIVVSRIPRPRGNLDCLKAKCSEMFDVDESSLFFLFSCSSLEEEEFVAMFNTERENGLVASYIQLFQGLNVKVAQDSIAKEIEKTENGMLSGSPKEVPRKIRELAALYPHPEVYRRAMRFFELTQVPEESAVFGVRLLDLAPNDEEAIAQVATFFLTMGGPKHRKGIVRRDLISLSRYADTERLLSISERAFQMGLLSHEQCVQLADVFEDLDQHEKSFEISTAFLNKDEVDPQLRSIAIQIAARSALAIGKNAEAQRFVGMLSPRALGGRLAKFALETRIEKGDKESAFEFAKNILIRDANYEVLETAIELARETDQLKVIGDLLNNNPELIERLLHEGNLKVLQELSAYGFDFSNYIAHFEPRVRRQPKFFGGGETRHE
ncbi:MAG: ParA family protein [Pirellulaceae bacterium]